MHSAELKIQKSFIISGPGCFTLIVFLLACGCMCSVSLPCGGIPLAIIFCTFIRLSFKLRFILVHENV